MRYYNLIITGILSLIFSGCSYPGSNSTRPPSPTPVVADNTNLNPEVYIIYKDGQILERSHQTDRPLISVDSTLAPISFSIKSTFSISSDQNYIAWYRADKGVIVADLVKKQIATVYQPSPWFNERPYLTFINNSHTLVFTDKKGTAFVFLNAENNHVREIVIPYPFGTIFSIAPDTSKIAFVEGYGQTQGVAKYLITSIQGDLINTVDTQIEAPYRHQIGWTADGGSLCGMKTEVTITCYPTNGAASFEVFQVEASEAIKNISYTGTHWLIETNQNLLLMNSTSLKIERKVPLAILSQFSRATVMLNPKQEIIVEELVTGLDGSYPRLWQVSWQGMTDLLIPKYGIISQTAL